MTMPHDGRCHRCGYKAPITCFLDDAQFGPFLALFADLPHEVQKPYLRYLSLFRPASGCTLQPSKSERLTRELLALVGKGYVSQQGKVDRPCPPSLWVLGMERMLEQAASLTLPMKNHNYLRTIVYQMADQADARNEQQVRREEVDGSHRVCRQPTDEGMSEIMRKYLAQYGEPHDAK